MVQTIICRNWREGGGLSSGSGLGVVFSTNSLLDLGAWSQCSVSRHWQSPPLTERNKTQQRCLVCGFWLLGSGFGDLKCDPLTPAQTLTVEMQIIIKINPWRPNAINCIVDCVGFVSIQVFSILIFWSPPLKLSTQYLVGKLLDGWISFNVRINIYKFQSKYCCLKRNKIKWK